MSEENLLVMPYDGTEPQFSSPPAHAGPGAAVLGRVTVGRDSWFGAGAAVRADGHYVRIGDDFRLGARGTIHIAHDVHPTHIGDGVTAGVNSIIHACDVGHRCHIGRDAVILDGARVGEGAAIGDGAVVFPRSELEGGWLYEGQPAKPVRRLEPGELDALHAESRSRDDEPAPAATPAGARVDAAGHLFVAPTARIAGRVVAGAEVGIWFGTELDAGAHEIAIGESSNIQDNTVIRCEGGPVSVGRETTVGHNVTMTDCTVGARSLVGMGAVLAAGTVVEDDVLLAAGARTEPGQRLESGWLYGGSPARQLSRLDDRKRGLIASSWPVYCVYARRFEAARRA